MTTFDDSTIAETKELLKEDSVTLEQVYNLACSLNRRCKDNLVSIPSLYVFCHPSTYVAPEGATRAYVSYQDNLQFLSKHSLSQICTILGVPIRYAYRCLKEEPNLLEKNMNVWLSNLSAKQGDKELLVRTFDSKIVRGILSNKYSILDTHEIVAKLMENLTLQSMYSVKSYYISSERFHLRLIENTPLQVNSDELLYGGIQVDSSDVGRSTLTVRYFIYKQVCSNGLIIPKSSEVLFKQRHIGITSEDFSNKLNDSIDRLEDTRSISIERINDAMDIKYSAYLMNNEKDEAEFTHLLTKRIGLLKEHVNEVSYLISSKYEPNVWGLVNAITDVAQSYTLDQRIMIEERAGELL